LSTVAAGAAVVLRPPPALAALSEDDLAYANFGVAAELLLAEFYRRAIAAKLYHGTSLAALRRVEFNEREHYAALAGVLSGAGEEPPIAEDFEFPLPGAAFRTKGATARLGLRLERAVLGSYLSAAATIDDRPVRSVFVRIAASEAEHVSALSRISNGQAVGVSFPQPLDLEAAGAVIGPYIG